MAQTSVLLPGDAAQSLARSLGWFSLALGVTELFAPRAVCRAAGLDGDEALVQAYGAREIVTGLGILASGNMAPWVWGRVAGDALDLCTVGAALQNGSPRKDNAKVALLVLAAISAVDSVCALSLEEARSIREHRPRRDYSNRVGMPAPPDQMRGAAADAPIADDMRTPVIMRYDERAFVMNT